MHSCCVSSFYCSAVSSQLWVTPRSLSSLPYNVHCSDVAALQTAATAKSNHYVKFVV